MLAALRTGDEELDLAAVHLEPGQGSAETRKQQLATVVKERKGTAFVLLGDLNLRHDEQEAVLEATGCRNAFYSGSSWDPRIVQYDEKLRSYASPGHAFDRVFFSGACWAESWLVGRGRHFSAGSGFYVSDHLPVMAVLDVAEEYGRRRRRVAGTSGRPASSSAQASRKVEDDGDVDVATNADASSKRRVL